MTAFEYLKKKMPDISETNNLLWRNPDYGKATWRNVMDICREMEQLAANVTEIIHSAGAKAEYSSDYICEKCFDECYKYIVQY